MGKKILIILIAGILVFIVVGAYVYFTGITKKSNVPVGQQTQEELETVVQEHGVYSIVLSERGFDSKSIDIPIGAMLRIINSTEEDQNIRLVSESFKASFELKPGQAQAFPELNVKGTYSVEVQNGEFKLNVTVE